MTLIFVKPQDGQSVQMQNYVVLAKGMTVPTDLANSGQQADHHDPFLKKVETVRMDRPTRNVDVIDLMRRTLVPVVQDKEPTKAQMQRGSDKSASTPMVVQRTNGSQKGVLHGF